MNTVAVTVAPWSALRTNGKITKAIIKKSVTADSPYEFVTVSGGQALTVREAIANKVDLLEVRSDDHVNLIAAIYLDGGKPNVQ